MGRDGEGRVRLMRTPAPRSAWLHRWVHTIPLGLHSLLSGFLLLELLLIDRRVKGALFDSLDRNRFWPGLQDWFQIWFVPAK
jgi:hypothetical protein